ncbi:phosphoserine phosphatase [[Haemophilus] felis]|uniref:Phosphoserine phosphatase n=1 Tax=[Haemophilus] felis TaxID=123822 RepID=A0A1T0B911_9PAST|nr:phosphoserine phosphatase [[Haemophilus] felis]NBI41001.1 phosphoserine phosphatase [[Haemophilus] felis]OOS06389.1 phosphoserine phosphatase SerB [[Haemophilus] felis]
MPCPNLTRIIQHYSPLPNSFLASKVEGADKFILYGNPLNLELLQQFQQLCGENFTILEAWEMFNNSIVLLQGNWQEQWKDYAHQLQLDIALLNFIPHLSQGGLLVMDMDSTAIQIECIDEIAKLAGTGELVSSITAQAMRGELDFEQSLRRRVATLTGASAQILEQVRSHLPLMPGLTETVQLLKQYGWKIAIASGGFTYFTEYLQQILGLDHTVANQFVIENGKLTGELTGDIVHAQYKAETLQKLAQQYGIPMSATIAIGDGANDLPMLNFASLGVALHAKPKVQQQAQVVVNFADFSALLCLLSANEKLIKE